MLSLSIPNPRCDVADTGGDDEGGSTGVLNHSSDSLGGEVLVTSWARGAVAPLATSEIPRSRVVYEKDVSRPRFD